MVTKNGIFSVYGYFLFVCDTMKNEKTASILFTVKYIHFIMQISTEFLRQIMSSLSCPFRVVLPFVFICLNFSFVLAALFCHIKLNTNYVIQKQAGKLSKLRPSVGYYVCVFTFHRFRLHAYVHEGELILFNNEQ